MFPCSQLKNCFHEFVFDVTVLCKTYVCIVFVTQAMMQGILDMYKVMRDKFRATPAHGHYVFTLHDISHIVEGMLLLSPRKTKSKPRRARARRDNRKFNFAMLR